jgi:glycosyltransferase involved in cell wall biosynthesis
MKKICVITTTPLIVNAFLLPHLRHLQKRYAVTLMLPVPGEVPLQPLPGIDVIPLDVRREISPWHDLLCLLRLARLLRKGDYDLVHSFGPKAGLLAAVAGRIARVPARLHTFTGQVWATRMGPMRTLLRSADRSIARLATHILTDSFSQRDFLDSEGIVPLSKCHVLGQGSVCGVDVARFRPDPEARAAVRAELDLASTAPLVLYLGRINKDKGVLDLARAFGELSGASQAILLFVGLDEGGLRGEIMALCAGGASQVRFVPYTNAPERYLAAADILCLPSYREGFGTVIIEAAAAGVPVAASRIYGTVDAVQDGKTGLLFNPGDAHDIERKLSVLLEQDDLRRDMGSAARARAIAEFSQQKIVTALSDYYQDILKGV